MGPRSRESIAPPKYDDFFLHIACGRGKGHVVHAWSTAGEGAGTEPFILPQVVKREPPGTTGERLFDALFTGKVLQLYERLAEKPGSSLRLNLMIDPLDPDSGRLQELPWELLCRPGTPDFLALSRRRSIVRHLWISRAVPACPRPERLRILVVAASPRGREPLDLEGEIRNLKEALAPASDVEIAETIPSTLAGMREALLAQECHVLHFLGHGGEGVLCFETADGLEDPVSGTDLVNKLADIPTLRLVVLNACRSESVSGSLVMGGLPAVIAMREPIYDDSAIAFSQAFYGRLAAGDPVDAAVAEGRQAIPLASAEWAVPVLFMRTPEGELFPVEDLHPSRPQPPAIWLAAAALVLLAFLGISLASLGWLVSDGVAHLQEDRPAEARERFETALALAPGAAQIHADLAAAAERLGDEKAAEEHYREAVRLRPGSPVHLFNLGHYLNERRRFQESYGFLARAATILREDPDRNAELDRDRVDTYGELARAALQNGWFVEVGEALDAALKIDPDRAPLHRLRGEAALRQAKAREAVGHLQAAIDRYPRGKRGRVETLALLVEAYDRLGDAPAICRTVEGFRYEDPAGITPWAPSVEGISRNRNCPPGL